MKKGILCISALMAVMAYAQAPDTLWSRTYGGPYNEGAISVQQTSMGGYVFTGIAYVAQHDMDVWLVATDENGDTLWTKTYGHTGFDVGYCVQETYDGGYIIAGDKEVGYNYDVWLLKTDENGDTLWTKTYGGNNDDEAFWVQQMPDSGYVVYARTLSFGAPGIPSVWLLRTNAAGDTLWSKTYGAFRGPTGHKDIILPDGYMLACNMHVNNYLDFCLVRVDSMGDTLWTKTYGWDFDDYIFACTKTSDGGYIAAGATALTEYDLDVLLVKFNANGDTLWTKTFGGPEEDEAHSVHQVFDGGYILCGWTRSYGAGSYDFLMLRTNANGDMVWQTTWGGSATDRCYEVQVCADSSYVLIGETYSFGDAQQAWLIKTDSDVGIAEQPIIEPLEAHKNLTATIIRGPLQLPEGRKCRVFDITGRIVEPEKIAPGIYFVEIDNKIAQKVIKIR